MLLKELIERLQKVEAELGGDLEVGTACYDNPDYSDSMYFEGTKGEDIWIGFITKSKNLRKNHPNNPLAEKPVLVIE